VGGGAELDVAAVEPDQFGEPQAGLHGQGDERAVPATLPAADVGSAEEGPDFLGVKERHRCLVEALLGDRQHLPDELGVFRVT